MIIPKKNIGPTLSKIFATKNIIFSILNNFERNISIIATLQMSWSKKRLLDNNHEDSLLVGLCAKYSIMYLLLYKCEIVPSTSAPFKYRQLVDFSSTISSTFSTSDRSLLRSRARFALKEDLSFAKARRMHSSRSVALVGVKNVSRRKWRIDRRRVFRRA